MARAKYDPLEAAKIGADGEKPKDPPSSFKNQDLDISDVTVDEAPPVKVANRPHPKYRVVATGRVSLDGQICTIPKDTVLDSAGYGGEAGIARLVAQGLKLEMVQG